MFWGLEFVVPFKASWVLNLAEGFSCVDLANFVLVVQCPSPPLVTAGRVPIVVSDVLHTAVVILVFNFLLGAASSC